MSKWTPYQLFLAALMLITGSINTLSTKWADLSKDSHGHPFDHPFLQAVGMFMGELLCLLVFGLLICWPSRRRRTYDIDEQATPKCCAFNWFVFLPASCCDILGTSIMYIGLNLTYPSSFQMLRGAVMIFTALLSVAFLQRKISKHMWLGMFLVVCGLVLVGVSDIVFNKGDKADRDINAILTGDLLIIAAQVIVAVQMVYEEKILTKYNAPPLQAVGLEGLFGFVVLGLLLFPFYFIPGKQPFFSGDRVEDVFAAFRQMADNHIIIIATVGNILSIAFFNFSGISVTKELSATTRMVLDSCRTVIIWVVSLAVGWQPFSWQSFLVQLAGFILLMIGMCIYNDIVFGPFLRAQGCLKHDEDAEFKPLIEDDFGINTSTITDREAALRSSDDYDADDTPVLHDPSQYDKPQPVST